ncbi:MAG: inositol monophosphatase family protein [Alphaproteobacteria bacterium]|nr:inositol monophosphatase family protein [Alphaproteobacteria bacterium]
MSQHVRRSPHMNVMVEAAEKAGRGLLRDFGEVENLQVSRKGPGDFVSNADLKAEKTVMAVLQKARPKFSFLMEESGETIGEDTANRWIVDPLDGTTNFLHGIPHWAVSIALEKDGEIIAGVIYDPIKDEMFTAEKGVGALMNNRRLRVSGRENLADALLAVGSEKDPAFAPEIVSLQGNCSGIRRNGSACLDLCYVAAGRFDAYWERGLNAWDVAAGALIAKEAGAHVSEIGGGKSFIHGRNSIIAANPRIYPPLAKHIASAAPQKARSAS